MKHDKSATCWSFYMIHYLFRPLGEYSEVIRYHFRPLSEGVEVIADNKNCAALFEMPPVNDRVGHYLRPHGMKPSKTSGNGVALPPLPAVNARRGLD